MAGHRVVAVAGTHGKTTTTALLTGALVAAGADPTYTIGADVAATGSNAAEGAGDLFVAEADESDGAFLHYAPYAAIVTNIEADHLDHWVTEEAYATAFDAFAATVDPAGFLVCCVGCRCRSARGAAASGRPAGGDRVDAARRGRCGTGGAGRVHALGSRRPLSRRRAPGARRRAHPRLRRRPAGQWHRAHRDPAADGRKGEAGGVRVYDSYAHHPTEITGDLASARELAGDGRLLVAFQPHLVSRTRLRNRDGRGAGGGRRGRRLRRLPRPRGPDPSVTGALVASAVPLPSERVAFVPDLDDVPAALVSRARPGDLVLSLGAGSVTDVGPRVLELLGGDRA